MCQYAGKYTMTRPFSPSPTCPYPKTCVTASSRRTPFSRRCSRVKLTHSSNFDSGIEISYLYALPSFETASVTPSRSAHSEENCAGFCESMPVVMSGLSASSRDVRRSVSFWSQEG